MSEQATDKSIETLAAFSDDQLHQELNRRNKVANDLYWQERIKYAKYLCLGCGMPDSWHTTNCPTDTAFD